MSNSTRTGHPVLGIILGIVGILAALVLVIFTGIIGGGIALSLGLAAIIVGISSKKNCGKGICAVFFGVIAVLISVVFTLGTIFLIKGLQQKAVYSGSELSKYMNRPYLGLMGIANDIPDSKNFNEVLNQLLELSKQQQSSESLPFGY